MALTRTALKELGIEAETIDKIISLHLDTVNALKDERDTLREKAGKAAEAQAEVERLKQEAAERDGKDPWKVRYDALREDFEGYKAEQAAKETKAAKSTAYRALLKEAGVSEKRIDAVLRVTDLDGIKLDKDGKVKDADTVKDTIKNEWADFIVTETTTGANTANPPQNTGGSTMTRADIYKTDEQGRFVYDATQRQAALSQLIAAEQQKGG